jgi:hypothetical protein
MAGRFPRAKAVWQFRGNPGSTGFMTPLLRRWWWLLPVGALFFGCVALRMNGSSIGAWQSALKEPAPIRDLVLSTPKRIRSDEWAVWTPSVYRRSGVP